MVSEQEFYNPDFEFFLRCNFFLHATMAEDSSSEARSSLATVAGSDIQVNPNQRLSSVLLNEFNYRPWSCAVSLGLGGRSKLGYVNGVIEALAATSFTYES